MKKNVKNLIYSVSFTLGGMLAGLGCYFAGCASGLCPITANPVRAMVYAGIMGWLLSVLFRKEPKNEQEAADCGCTG